MRVVDVHITHEPYALHIHYTVTATDEWKCHVHGFIYIMDEYVVFFSPAILNALLFMPSRKRVFRLKKIKIHILIYYSMM